LRGPCYTFNTLVERLGLTGPFFLIGALSIGVHLRVQVPLRAGHSEQSKVKRSCVRATERGEEAWSVNREPMDKNHIEGVAKQGEQAYDCTALVTKSVAA